MKTRHATLEQLVEIEDAAAEAIFALDPLLDRADDIRKPTKSRHYRRLMRKHVEFERRLIAAQKQANRILHPQDPEFLF